jgi:hypothetical protein
MFEGGCACGAIRYECADAPLAMLNCHCRDCQRAGGAGHAPSVIVVTSALRVTHGATKHYARAAESGNTARREFCADCGSPLFAGSSARPDFTAIRAGSLDDPSRFAPSADVWVASAQPWDAMDPALPKFERSRGR